MCISHIILYIMGCPKKYSVLTFSWLIIMFPVIRWPCWGTTFRHDTAFQL